jgi:hypothetical protein
MASLPRRMPSTHASSSSPPWRSGARSVWWCWRLPRRILTRPSTHGSRRWSPRSPSSSSSSPSSIPSSHARGRCWTPCHQASSRVGLRLHDLCRDPSPSTLKGIASTHLTGIVGMGRGSTPISMTWSRVRSIHLHRLWRTLNLSIMLA